ncbi:hypothetical protein [Micromonospora sp. CPCC 205556]|uniref:hypothetical protein n=1 Tax=Micromonospora sp. CPCC 205556 TaxID=3122398 RepID=UPI002FF1CAC7
MTVRGLADGPGPTGHAARGRRRAGRHHRRDGRHGVPPASPPPLRDGPVEVPPTHRRGTLVALCVVATATATALVAGLLGWTPESAGPARALTVGESERLAAARVTNYRDLRAGVRVTAGTGGARVDLVGWVDWARQLAYLDVGGPGAGPHRGLLQATPTVVVARPDPTAVLTPAPPPLIPPTDRWRLRDLPDGRGPGAVLELLFGLAADRPEPTDPLLRGGGRWVGRTRIGGEQVDVLQAPLPRPATADRNVTPSAPPAAGDRDPRWWVDGDARLHRWEGRLPDGNPVTVELERSDRPTLWAVDALGGRPGLPRALTDAEAARLDRLPTRLRAVAGAAVTVAAPLGAAANLRGSGWLRWTGQLAYLSVADLDTLGRHTLLRRDAAGFARAEVPLGAGPTGAPDTPPLPPPTAAGWRPAAGPTDDLDRLVDAALRAGGTAVRPGSAVRLRGDRVAGHPVDVLELRAQGLRLRYWIDHTGLLRRLELRTGQGAWAQLDLNPGPVPAGMAPTGPTAPATRPKAPGSARKAATAPATPEARPTRRAGTTR